MCFIVKKKKVRRTPQNYINGIDYLNIEPAFRFKNAIIDYLKLNPLVALRTWYMGLMLKKKIKLIL